MHAPGPAPPKTIPHRLIRARGGGHLGSEIPGQTNSRRPLFGRTSASAPRSARAKAPPPLRETAREERAAAPCIIYAGAGAPEILLSELGKLLTEAGGPRGKAEIYGFCCGRVARAPPTPALIYRMDARGAAGIAPTPERLPGKDAVGLVSR